MAVLKRTIKPTIEQKLKSIKKEVNDWAKDKKVKITNYTIESKAKSKTTNKVFFGVGFSEGRLTHCCGIVELGNIEVDVDDGNEENYNDSSSLTYPKKVITSVLTTSFLNQIISSSNGRKSTYMINLIPDADEGNKIMEEVIKRTELFNKIADFINPNSRNRIVSYITKYPI